MSSDRPRKTNCPLRAANREFLMFVSTQSCTKAVVEAPTDGLFRPEGHEFESRWVRCLHPYCSLPDPFSIHKYTRDGSADCCSLPRYLGHQSLVCLDGNLNLTRKHRKL